MSVPGCGRGEDVMPIVLAQTMAEYGLLTGLVAGITAFQYRLESYIGTGNTKYLVLGGILLFLAFWSRRRRY